VALAAIVRSSHDAVIAKTTDGTVTSWNDGATVVYGHRAEDMLGRSIELTIPADELQAEQARHARVAGGASESGYRCTRLRADGRPVTVVMSMSPVRDQTGAIIGVASISRPVSDEESTATRRASLLEAAPDAMVCVDQDGRIVLVNARACGLFGYERDELAGSLIEILLPAGAQGGHVEHRAAFFRDPHPRPMGAGLRLRASRRDGSTFPVEVSLAADTHDSELIAVAAIRDVTGQREIEASLHEAESEARAANDAKNRFLSRMSHELRTPLNAVLGFGQLLEIHLASTEHEDAAHQVVRAGRHLLNLIDEVLDIARIEAGEMTVSPEPVAIAGIVSETAVLMRPLADTARVALSVAGGPADAYVLADRQRLAQILLNLLSNAVKYNRPGGHVWLSWEAVGQRASITVRDDGPGIAEHLRDRVFTAFDRLGAESSGIEGTGVGLTVSQGLAGLMHGSLSFEPVEGGGASFAVTLPASTEPVRAQRDPVAERPDTDRSAGSATVLYIEDNESNVRVMESVLALRPAWHLIHAGLASLGTELARAHRPDLVLLDLHLPDGTGLDVLAALQRDEATATIPVVVLSADASKQQVRRLLAAGAARYLTKPLDVPDVLSMLDSVFADANRTPRHG